MNFNMKGKTQEAKLYKKIVFVLLSFLFLLAKANRNFIAPESFADNGKCTIFKIEKVYIIKDMVFFLQ